MFNQSALGRRLLLYIITFSFFITLITSGTIIYSDYRAGVKTLNSSIERIEAVYLPSIAFSLWNFDYGQLLLQLKGIDNFPGVIACRVLDEKGSLVRAHGEVEDHKVVEEFYFPLTFNDSGKDQDLGKLVIAITKEEIYKSLISKVIVILVSQFFKTLAVSLFILFIVYQLITRHINKMSLWAKDTKSNVLNDGLILDRSPLLHDELTQVTSAINVMHTRILEDKKKLDLVNQELELNNAELENRVNSRTFELNNMITRLQETIDELTETQGKLIEAEKHAALGQLVAGVAHEINTPLGLCVTTQSYIQDNIAKMQDKVASGNMTKNQFMDCYDLVNDSMALLKTNLSRASELVHSFKQVAAQADNQELDEVNVQQQIELAQLHLSSTFQAGNYSLEINGNAELSINSYPTAVESVLQTLLQNSLHHGFPNHKGHITIEFTRSGEMLELYYQDDGIGIPEEDKERIFDPFFTTGRDKGHTGLGLNMAFNIVTQLLGGTIILSPTERGVFFQITLQDFTNDKKPS